MTRAIVERKRRSIRCIVSCLLALLLTAGTVARAQTCTFSIPNPDFGNVDVLAAGPVDLTTQATISCTGASTPYIHACVSLGSRGMTGPGGVKLNYDMYIDAARTRPWGSLWDSTANNVLTAEIPMSGGAGSTSVPVYVRIFDGQTDLPVGAYSQGFLGAGYTGFNVVGYTSAPTACTTGSGPQTPPSFTTRATVIAGCSVSASNIDFGQMGVIGQAVNATGVLTLTCTKSATVTIALDAGVSVGAKVASRAMTRMGGTELLQYQLYRDAARTQRWGDGSQGTSTLSLTGAGAAQTATVYGSVPAQNMPPPGTYNDTITVTVTF
ncbi:Csu type fimbrial protein [Lysobacter auxotrophicus]|uniref:Spore coat U domain-containing protein n=1 Tax=Lysobacter auxotrophicus TaxID=2992573 RepID=A0ABM8DCB6_9GAMM|nr:spore coat protein U domain-containing protein [Lysobacter auxotrophicus]BDU16231.1 spore coat U domain-containing protein [Lysobacter auxotrophicus]